MNIADFTKTIFPVTELYSKTLSAAAIQLYFEDVEFLDAETFRSLLKKHRASEQGKFWPTFSHLIDLAGTENDAGVKAGIDFDNNLKIDGTGHFDIANETVIKRASRRKIWVERKKLEWKNIDPIERLQGPLSLPDMSVKKDTGHKFRAIPKPGRDA